jgi:Flp pilus assembly protein TadG
MGRSLPTRRSERGATVVELSLVLPVLLSLTLGILTGGEAYSTKVQVVEAVREGARFGASLLLGTNATAVSDYETSVRNRVVSASNGALASTDVCVKLVLATGATDCGVTDPAGASSEPTVHVVKVSATKQATLQFFFFSRTVTLAPKLAARYERDTG